MTTPTDDRSFEAVMVARGFRVIGALSPDADTCTDAELDLLFPVDVTGVLRDILRLPAVPERETTTRQTSATVVTVGAA